MTFARSVAIFSPDPLYKAFISPLIAPRCKYDPSCASMRFRRFGLRHTAGSRAGGLARMRCNPWSHGGYDPVEDQRLFGARAATHRAP